MTTRSNYYADEDEGILWSNDPRVRIRQVVLLRREDFIQQSSVGGNVQRRALMFQ
jgi:hypothetical protein